MGGGWAECDFNALAALGHRLRGENCETPALVRRLGCFMSVRRAGAGVLMNFAAQKHGLRFVAISIAVILAQA